MKSLIAALMIALPGGALAAPAAGPGPRNADPARMEKRLRTARTISLAMALDLNADEAMKIDAAMAPFDERRKAIHEQVKQAKETIARAADGDPAATAQLDASIQKVFDARSQAEALDREMFTAVTKGMQPQQKARFAVFLAHFRQELERRMGHGNGGHFGHGGQGMRE